MSNKTIASDSFLAGSLVHVFEAAGLGIAPFKFKEFSVGNTQCDFCATHIHNIFWIQSSDNKTFKVGCDCVEKTNDQGLRRIVSRIYREHQTMIRKAREKRIMENIENEINNNEETKEILRNLPHPFGFRNLSFLDYANFMLKNAGVSGKTKLSRMVSAALNKAINEEKK